MSLPPSVLTPAHARAHRRVMSIYLPDLCCELATRENEARSLPLATIATHGAQSSAEPAKGDVLSAVNEAARALGVRAGQTVAEARAIASNLVVRTVTADHLVGALGRVAEVALAFGQPVSITSGDERETYDTVWVDITRSGRLHRGEEAALFELAARVRDFGHRMRIAIADGPRLAKAAAVFAADAETIVPAGEGAALMGALPLYALPLSRDHVVWLNRLGLWTVSDVTALPPEAMGSRLGHRFREALDLALGKDDSPLIAYEAPCAPSETAEWDEGVASIEPLLFTLRALTSRLAARLKGRGQAVQSLELWAPYDTAIAALRRIAVRDGDEAGRPGLRFRIDLPSPLTGQEDLFRVLKSKLEHCQMEAPARSLTICARALTDPSAVQLSLRGDSTTDADPKALAILLAELSSEIGPLHVGVMQVVEVHRPEARTQLGQLVDFSEPDHLALRHTADPSDAEFPTRLLQRPLALASALRPGATLTIDHHLFTIERVKHAMRIDQVEWWTADPVCRDYLRVWLTSGRKNVEAWVYSDRKSGRAYLHGFFD